MYEEEPILIPHFQGVQGPDHKWWWAKCPRCGEVVLNKDGTGPARHWKIARHKETAR